MKVTYLLDLCFHIPLVLEEHNLGYDKGFGGASKVVFGGMIDRIDHIQMAFDLKNNKCERIFKNRVRSNSIQYYSSTP